MTTILLLFLVGSILLAAEVVLPGGMAGVLGGVARPPPAHEGRLPRGVLRAEPAAPGGKHPLKLLFDVHERLVDVGGG